MKLLNLTTSYLAVLLFILLTLWAVLFYYQMLDEIYDSLDDGLENQKMLVMSQAAKNKEILQTSAFNEGYFTIKEVAFKDYKDFKESYRDTLMYMQNEKDFEPVRLLESVFPLDGSYYKIKVITSMVEEDDLIEDLLFSLVWLYIGLLLSILILNNWVLKKIWNPFYLLINQLKTFRLQDAKKPVLQPSNIVEFQLLQKSLEKFMLKAQESYQHQKEFIENASHEMQTPLAVVITNLERLLETVSLEQEQLEIVEKTLTKMESLTRFNKSLLLLSKIKNHQFIEAEMVLFNEVMAQILEDFNDLITYKKMRIKYTEKEALSVHINKELAQILITNLVKNGLVHTPEGGTITIVITAHSLEISNTGEVPLDEDIIFKRFFGSGTSSSNGLGLAIVKSIADIYSLQLKYQYNGRHTFLLLFDKEPL